MSYYLILFTSNSSKLMGADAITGARHPFVPLLNITSIKFRSTKRVPHSCEPELNVHDEIQKNSTIMGFLLLLVPPVLYSQCTLPFPVLPVYGLPLLSALCTV